MEKISFMTEDGVVEFAVLEETKIAGITYLLVTDSDEDEEEASCYIMKEICTEAEDTVYEMVEDDAELGYIAKIFEELLEDTDIVSE